MLKKEMKCVSKTDVESGIKEFILPFDTPLKPACYAKYAYKMHAYPVENNEYGCNCFVYEDEDPETHRKYKKLYTNMPDEMWHGLFEFSKKSCKSMRDDDEHADKRRIDDYEDGNGEWHGGIMDQIAYSQFIRSREENETEVYDESVLHGPLSNNHKIRNAQIRNMCDILDKAIGQFSPTLRKTYEDLFCLCRKEVDVAAEEDVGKSAITNRKNRLVNSIRDILLALGYVAPSKAELKAERKASEEREQRIAAAIQMQREDEMELIMARTLTALFYSEGVLDNDAVAQIEKELDEAA